MCRSLVTLLLVFAAVAIANSQYNVHPCYGHQVGFARDFHSCAHFWHCGNNGVTSRGVCPNGRLFDVEKQQCLVKDQVRCFQCPNEPFRLLSVARACPQYIMCFNGAASLNGCPPGLVFDGRSGVHNCNYEPYPGGCHRENDVSNSDPEVERCPAVTSQPVYIPDRRSCSV